MLKQVKPEYCCVKFLGRIRLLHLGCKKKKNYSEQQNGLSNCSAFMGFQRDVNVKLSPILDKLSSLQIIRGVLVCQAILLKERLH